MAMDFTFVYSTDESYISKHRLSDQASSMFHAKYYLLGSFHDLVHTLCIDIQFSHTILGCSHELEGLQACS